MQPISSASTKRFRALIADVAAVSGMSRPAGLIALADRLRPTAVYRLDLDTGCLSTEGSTYDIIILDSAAARRLSTDGIGVLKTFLGPEGVIAIRRPQSWTGAVRRFFRRRGDDVSPNPFLRGLPRSGAAFLQARLHVVELRVRINVLQRECWVIGSPAPLGDTRYRDQIGRVATDYLRVVGPILAGTHLPGI